MAGIRSSEIEISIFRISQLNHEILQREANDSLLRKVILMQTLRYWKEISGEN